MGFLEVEIRCSRRVDIYFSYLLLPIFFIYLEPVTLI